MNTAFLHSQLLTWFDNNKRDLPWRKTQNPYQILLSEVLLQQTQVSRGIFYFNRFLEMFPTVEDLAVAPLERVLKAWEGAGYYARARNLHKAAEVITANKMPSTFAGLLELPGVGRYTAGAVASIALGLAIPVVDGNVRRVLARWLCQPVPTENWLWENAEQLLNRSQPGNWNQAIMELGATVCTPKNPSCATCPVSSQCQAFQTNKVTSIPAPKPRAAVKEIKAVALIIGQNGRYLLEQRPKKGLLGCLYGFPLQEIETDPEAALEVLLKPLKLKTSTTFLGLVNHTMTHRQFQIWVYAVSKHDPHFQDPNGLALSRLDQKILTLLELPALL